ncbi:MAG: cytochrome c [Nevskiaceae bacterium]|nr:MAG: cytochrome c [Nevskiaceae bacterium]TBR73035.1 MAG: cytochrome c [Nevskiaceae bacterium]
MSKAWQALVLLALPACALAAQPVHYAYGTTPTAAQVKGWDVDVFPDGEGLPPGQGTVAQGEPLYEARCSACHGLFGEGVAKFPNLNNSSLDDLKATPPVKTIGNYWPYAPKIFDYIRRAMPFPMPGSLTDEETYAITAYLLNLNNLVGSDFVADAQTLAKVQMPNRNGLIVNDLKPDTHAKRCMKGCAAGSALEVKTNAKDLKGLTPPTTGPADGK